MGDLADLTAVTPVGEGHFTATLSRDFEIWGPMGGYVASVALRAAGAAATLPRPASFFCHYLRVAKFAPVDLHVTTMRSGRTAESLRVVMSQEGKHVLDATVSVITQIDDADSLVHDAAEPPDVPGPEALPNLVELMGDDLPPFAFWRNFDARPVHWNPEWPPPGPETPEWREWLRFVPRSTFDDPWVDACRSVLLIDLPSWPAGSRPHGWRWKDGPEWIAPSLDLYVAFHRFVPDDPWLLIEGFAPIATAGLLGWHGSLWSSDRQLVATGGGQALFRRITSTSAT